MTYREVAALRTYRRWYKTRCQRDWGYKWKWVAWDYHFSEMAPEFLMRYLKIQTMYNLV